MSYLPRMSKTYKEPQESFFEELGNTVSYNSIKPASSLLNEKTFNPQMILRHYKYLPHAPPVLPGPSVLEELREHELLREANRLRRNSNQTEDSSKTSEEIIEPVPEENESCMTETESSSKAEDKAKRSSGRKTFRKRSGRKKSAKSIKKPSQSKIPTNMSLKHLGKAQPDSIPEKALGDSELTENKEDIPVGEKSSEEKLESKSEDSKSRGVQCTIFGSNCKMFVIPTVVSSLLRVLAFLTREMSREGSQSNILGEKKSFITQIQTILGDLCNYKMGREYTFDLTYSDFKRLEKISGELEKYMKNVYGDKGEYIDKMEDLKKVYIQLKKKDMELAFLNEKLQESNEKTVQEVVVKETDLKNSEITLQNKRLESEQLAAEVEFSCRELKECQKSIAEVEWEIRDFQEQINNLKKSVSSKPKSGGLSRRGSLIRFSGEMVARGSRSRESDSAIKKKT